MTWTSQLKGDSLTWLLEHEQPLLRYLALRDLQETPPQDPSLLSARHLAHQVGPIAEILSAMHPQGFFEEPGEGYNPKYRSTVWTVTLLAQLGASIKEDARLLSVCEYIFENSLCAGGKFTYNGVPSGTIDCLQGNLCWALSRLGCEDPLLDEAYAWMARTVTAEGIATRDDKTATDRYYSAKSGPNFECGANSYTPCAWGAVKVLLAFSNLPSDKITSSIQRAIQSGLDFLLSVDPVTAAYPSPSGKPNQSWFKFGFPVFYVTDLLQLAEVLLCFLPGTDPRLANLLQLVRDKQDEDGCWSLEYPLTGKTLVDFGAKNQPNPWVTLRALRVLKAATLEDQPARWVRKYSL